MVFVMSCMFFFSNLCCWKTEINFLTLLYDLVQLLLFNSYTSNLDEC